MLRVCYLMNYKLHFHYEKKSPDIFYVNFYVLYRDNLYIRLIKYLYG